MPLVGHFRSVAVAGVAANIHHRRHRTRAIFGDVEIGRDVEFRQALEGDFLDEVTSFIERAADLHIERGALGPGQQSEHIAHFFEAAGFLFFPGGYRKDLLFGAVGDGPRLSHQIRGDLLFAFEHAAIGLVSGLRRRGEGE